MSDSWIGEHLAEMVAIHLAPNEAGPWVRKFPGFQMPLAVLALLTATYGAR
jgi:hypothetical protein